MQQRVSVDDFFTGLFAEFVTHGIRTLSLRGTKFDEAIERAFQKLEQEADGQNLNLRFWLATHNVHGDSTAVRDAITTAAQRGIVSLDNPEYQDIRIKLSPDEASLILDHIPGGRELFARLAREFRATYEAPHAA